jgi:hypothetical protein
MPRAARENVWDTCAGSSALSVLVGPAEPFGSVAMIGVTVNEFPTIPLACANCWPPFGRGVALSKLVTVTMTVELAGSWKSECRKTGQPAFHVMVSLRIVRLRDSPPGRWRRWRDTRGRRRRRSRRVGGGDGRRVGPARGSRTP